MSSHQRSTDSMVEFNKGKSISKSKAVDDAIKRLIKNSQPINFNSVVAEAGVSKSYLYNHPDHRRRIEELRQQQTGRTSQKLSRSEKSDASKDVIIASLKKRIQEIENRVSLLESENKKLRGKIYDNI
ncbi:MAG: hypothetical protein H6Q67_2218 [Firmicutes bacterium]|nr:hypothetical protein [Bacillota bacterium]